MKYPIIGQRGKKELNIRGMGGGINLRDGVNAVNDNQLTESVNVWIKDGILKSRPAAVTDKALTESFGRVAGTQYTDGIKVHSDIRITKIIYEDGSKIPEYKDYVLVSATAVNMAPQSFGSGYTYAFYISFYFQGAEDVISIGDLGIEFATEVSAPYDSEALKAKPTYFVFMQEDKLYCFTSDRKIHTLDLSSDSYVWIEAAPEECYIPTVMTGCTADTRNNYFDKAAMTPAGVSFEGYNLICPYYKAVYTTVNSELLDETNTTSSHKMIYYLPVWITSELSGYKVKASITNKDGDTAEHEITINAAALGNLGEENDINPIDGLKMILGHYYLQFYDENGEAVVTAEDKVADNMIITAPYRLQEEMQDKVFKMTESEWFSGASEGINGGTRLFLGGNTIDKEKSLMIWSGANKPLYFSENCYSYVGNSTQRLIAFGKQSDMLVIFKDREIWFTQYSRNGDISAEDLTEQSVVDYGASSVYFPLVQLHSAIGCDCPDTIQLCRNRLIWTCSNGKVYSLVTQNQYSERNVYEVGAMVERSLKTLSLKNAHSCDFDGHYVLLAGNDMFLMDYNSSGYQYAYSYKKEEDSNIYIPWFYFKLPFENIEYIDDYGMIYEPFGCTNVSDRLMMFSVAEHRTGQPFYASYRLDGEGTDDYITNEPSFYSDAPLNTVDLPFESVIQTKFFEFGAEGYLKNIDLLRFFLANNDGVPIEVRLITESGEDSEEIFLEEPESEPFSAGYLATAKVYPSIRAIERLGIRLRCEGLLALDGFAIRFSLLK